jgi:hypothetical protein
VAPHRLRATHRKKSKEGNSSNWDYGTSSPLPNHLPYNCHWETPSHLRQNIEVLHCVVSTFALVLQEAHRLSTEAVILQEIPVIISFCETSLNEMWSNKAAAYYHISHIYKQIEQKTKFCHFVRISMRPRVVCGICRVPARCSSGSRVGSQSLVTDGFPTGECSLGACRLVNDCCAVEMSQFYPSVALLAASKLPTSGGDTCAGTSHPASVPVVPDAALCSGKAPTSPPPPTRDGR